MFRESLQRSTLNALHVLSLTLTNGAGARVGARVFFIGSTGEGFLFGQRFKDAQSERKRVRNYYKSRQECLEGIFDVIEAAEVTRGWAVKESDPHAKEVLELQATSANSKAFEELKSVILTIEHIIELSETNAVTKISHAEAIKEFAFEQYNEAEAKLKKMNEGAG